MESIMNTQKGVCFVCNRVTATELHHIFFGHGLRKISDREGIMVYLCHECHQGTDGVHGKNGAGLNHMLKEMGQEEWEKQYVERYPYKNHADMAAREAFRKLMGRSWI